MIYIVTIFEVKCERCNTWTKDATLDEPYYATTICSNCNHEVFKVKERKILHKVKIDTANPTSIVGMIKDEPIS